MTKKYWCPTCEEVTSTDFLGIADMMQHRGGCRAKFVPLVEPLDVPEVTTWGESGGAEAVCVGLSDDLADSKCNWTDVALGSSAGFMEETPPYRHRTARVYPLGNWWIWGPTHDADDADDTEHAINYVAGVRK